MLTYKQSLTIVSSAVIWFLSFDAALLLSPSPVASNNNKRLGAIMNRRDALLSTTIVGSSLASPKISNSLQEDTISKSTMKSDGLGSKLAKRDPALLRNSVFNIPPTKQIYPSFMVGDWDIQCRFNGYIFPSTAISKQELTNNFLIPGFQKCSIAALSDVGRDDVSYKMRITNDAIEDRVYTITQQINAFLGYDAVSEVIYDPSKNPNRISIIFIEYKTRNAERIELFFNGRESELYEQSASGSKNTNDNIFVCSEYVRQVTFGTSSTYGVARQVVGNYAHYWTWRQSKDNDDMLTGNVLTCAYLDPQDPLFFKEPSKPVAIYSHVLTASKIKY